MNKKEWDQWKFWKKKSRDRNRQTTKNKVKDSKQRRNETVKEKKECGRICVKEGYYERKNDNEERNRRQ